MCEGDGDRVGNRCVSGSVEYMHVRACACN